MEHIKYKKENPPLIETAQPLYIVIQLTDFQLK